MWHVCVFACRHNWLMDLVSVPFQFLLTLPSSAKNHHSSGVNSVTPSLATSTSLCARLKDLVAIWLQLTLVPSHPLSALMHRLQLAVHCHCLAAAKWLQLLGTLWELDAVMPSSSVPLWKWVECTWSQAKASFCRGYQKLWLLNSQLLWSRLLELAYSSTTFCLYSKYISCDQHACKIICHVFGKLLSQLIFLDYEQVLCYWRFC